MRVGGIDVRAARPPGVDEWPPGEPWRRVVRHVVDPRWRSVVVSVVLVLAVAITLLVALPRPRAGAVKAIDPAPVVAEALAYPGFVAYTPDPLPVSWTPNSARFSTAWVGPVLHIGYRAPDGGYVGIEQTTGTNSRLFVDTEAAGAVPDGTVAINGVTWWKYQSDRKQQDSLVYYGPSSTLVITGTASDAELQQLAASLHIRP